MTTPATNSEEVGELLGDNVEESIISRLVDTGATIDEIVEALEDLLDELRFAEQRAPSSPRVAEARTILEELMANDPDPATLSIIDDELE